MTLLDVPLNQPFTIGNITCEDTTLQLLRLGLGHGQPIHVSHRGWLGPVVIQANHAEVALGRDLASHVQLCPAG